MVSIKGITISVKSYLCTYFVIAALIKDTSGLGCFRCASYNGSNPRCHDPFNDTIKDFYEDNCFALLAAHDAGKSDQYLMGNYPSFYCVKIVAPMPNNDTQVTVIRECTTSDIGSFNYGIKLGDLDYPKGFVKSCTKDGCNGAWMYSTNMLMVFAGVMFGVSRNFAGA